jgi:Arc/MetJ-type ribon-helix-helix transcriptional regulator
MHIELPQDLIQRVQRRTAAGEGITEAEVIRKALDALDWQDNERKAIQAGIDAMREGRVQDFDEFDRDFRERNGIATDP